MEAFPSHVSFPNSRMPRCSRRRDGTSQRPSPACSRPSGRSHELPTGALGRTAPHGKAFGAGRTDRPHGPRAAEPSTGTPGHSEPPGLRRRPSLHPALPDELRNRLRFLSPGVVHHEIQSQVHRGTRGPPDRDADPPGPGRIDRAGRLAPPV